MFAARFTSRSFLAPAKLLVLALPLLTVAAAPGRASADPGILPFKPGLTVGAVIGRLEVDDTVTGDALGVYGIVKLGRVGFTGEVSRTSYEANDRVDRQTGGGLTVRLISISDVTAFVRITLGLNRVWLLDEVLADQVYVSGGPGLDVLLTRNISVTAELLLTGRRTIRENSTMLAVDLVPESEELTHLRVGLALSF